MFEKVSRPLQSHSNFFFGHIYTCILMDTSPNHITPAHACACRGKRRGNKRIGNEGGKEGKNRVIREKMGSARDETHNKD